MDDNDTIPFYTRKQVERAVKQAAENLSYRIEPTESEIIEEVMEYIDVLEDLPDETVLTIPKGTVL